MGTTLTTDGLKCARVTVGDVDVNTIHAADVLSVPGILLTLYTAARGRY